MTPSERDTLAMAMRTTASTREHIRGLLALLSRDYPTTNRDENKLRHRLWVATSELVRVETKIEIVLEGDGEAGT